MRIWPATIAIIFLFAGCTQKPRDVAPWEETASDTAADGNVELQVLDYDDLEQLIASHLGQVVVMDVWSTSCAPCVKEFPKLVALQAQYGPERLACVSLSLDYEGIGAPEEQEPKVRKFLEGQRATFENVLGSEESDVLRRKLKIASPPVVFVYDKSGKLRKRFDNEKAVREADVFTYEQVGQLVAELLNEEMPAQPAESTPAKLDEDMPARTDVPEQDSDSPTE